MSVAVMAWVREEGRYYIYRKPKAGKEEEEDCDRVVASWRRGVRGRREGTRRARVRFHHHHSVPLRVGVVPVRSTGTLTGAGLLQGEHAWMQSLSFLDTPPTLLPPVLFPTLSLVTFSSLSSAFEAHISSSFSFCFFSFLQF